MNERREKIIQASLNVDSARRMLEEAERELDALIVPQSTVFTAIAAGAEAILSKQHEKLHREPVHAPQVEPGAEQSNLA